MELEEFFRSRPKFNIGGGDSDSDDSNSEYTEEEQQVYFGGHGQEARLCQQVGKKEPEHPATAGLEGKPPQRVQLNRKILLRGVSAMHLTGSDMNNKQMLRKFGKLTHLHLQNKKIDELASFHEFKNLTVLYLYSNNIDEIVGLEDMHQLEVLDLHDNQLDRISGLQGCKNLQKLYLGQNRIAIIEGLEELKQLQELYVENQYLEEPESGPLLFDPMTLETLSATLRILDVSGNKLETIEDLAGFQCLTSLVAKENEISDLDQTALVLSTMPSLVWLDFRGNPVAKQPKYREKMIGHAYHIEKLDGKDVSPVSREFIQRFWRMKAAKLKQNVERSQTHAHTLGPDVDGESHQNCAPEGGMGFQDGFPDHAAQAQANVRLQRLPRLLASKFRHANARLRARRSNSLPGVTASASSSGLPPNITTSDRKPRPRGRASDSEILQLAHTIASRNSFSRSRASSFDGPPGAPPQFMLTTPSFLPLQSLNSMSGGARKWMSALSPIPAGETEEEGDDEGDADPDAAIFKRPGSPKAENDNVPAPIAGEDIGPQPKVYQLPPWPHIQRLGLRKPVITFIP